MWGGTQQQPVPSILSDDTQTTIWGDRILGGGRRIQDHSRRSTSAPLWERESPCLVHVEAGGDAGVLVHPQLPLALRLLGRGLLDVLRRQATFAQLRAIKLRRA